MERTISHLQRRVRCVKRATVLVKNDEQEGEEAWDWGRDGAASVGIGRLAVE